MLRPLVYLAATALFQQVCIALPVEVIAQIKTRASDCEESYDYVVIGGGTSGLTVADRLSEDGKSACILPFSGDNPVA